MGKIAFIEDDPEYIDLLKDKLEPKTPYDCDFEFYESAGEDFDSQDYSVIICDYSLSPGYNGIDFSEDLLDRGFEGQFVLHTGIDRFQMNNIEGHDLEEVEERGIRYVWKGKSEVFDDLAEIIEEELDKNGGEQKTL